MSSDTEMSKISEISSSPEEEETSEREEEDVGTKVTSEVIITWYFDRAIQRPFLRSKWHNFERL